jgi:hypothetical protein
MAFTNNPYCTLAQVKSALDIQSTDANRDNWISNDLIPAAQAFIDQYCNRTWQTDGTVGSPATRKYDGNGLDYLMIDECVSISQVLYVVGSSQQDITTDVVLLPNSQVNNGKPGWKIGRLLGNGFEEGTQNYIVKGVFGNPTIPADISQACTRLVAHKVKLRDANYADSMSEQGGVRQHFSKKTPDDVIEVLNNYRRLYLLGRAGGNA